MRIDPAVDRLDGPCATAVARSLGATLLAPSFADLTSAPAAAPATDRTAARPFGLPIGAKQWATTNHDAMKGHTQWPLDRQGGSTG